MLAFPNNPLNIEANAHLALETGWQVADYPFQIPNALYYGEDRFAIEILEEGWEYVILICSPVELADPYGLTDTAYDLVYPFFSLAEPTGAEDAVAPAKGLTDGVQPAVSGAGQHDKRPLAPGKKLTVFFRKYWLKR